ncbi:Hypothetical protein R9X50_00187600 [Acrodontium crateriforme]|uniref:Small ribosomal subunit protein mS29 n=1 Tax=Acrodontium crateriforme TaxID=150365 RepID=A0AAQ3M5X8_9PEZI|nr:Hypothetical protein R9X50_00187600 [Acrodontium crateriforme]
MSSPLCLRCLRRSLQPLDHHAASVQRAAFSTTPALGALPPKKKGAANTKPTMRGGSSLKLTKNTRVASGRPPAPGERKALRKRVVLSNTNAIEVRHLQDLTKDLCKDVSALTEAHGKVVGLENETVDAMRALEAFKATQGWNLFRRPAVLVRKETIEMAETLHDAQSKKKTVSKVLYGSRGSGKSVLQLQAMALAQQRGWIVLHFPEAKELTIGHAAYEPVITENGTEYIQPGYTAHLLGNFARANKAVLSKLHLSQQHKLPIPIQPDITLDRFIELGANDPEIAWPIWSAMMIELTAPSKSDKGLQRPPLFVGLDGLDHIMRDSAYLDMDAKPVHAHSLTLVRDFVGLLSGSTKLPNGGMVVAAVSESNRARAPTLDYCLETNSGESKPLWDPYMPQDDRVISAFKNVPVQLINGLSKDEARGIMEYYAQSGMLRSTVTDLLVSETWTLAGNGLIGEVERGSVRMRM